MSCGIYKITNLISNKCYIGQSIHIEKRWQEHKQQANPINKSFDKTKHLYKAISKYGVDNFKFEIICECQAEKLNKLEQYYIKVYNSADPNFGYNYQLGGDCCRPRTPEYVFEVIAELKESNETINEMAARLCLSRRTIYRINIGESWPQECEQYPIRTFSVRTIRALSTEQGRHKHEVYLNLKTNGRLSEEEYLVRRAETCCKPKYVWPDIDTLANKLFNSSFVAVGKEYGVTDNTIRKLCKKYGIPTHKQQFIDWYIMKYQTK